MNLQKKAEYVKPALSSELANSVEVVLHTSIATLSLLDRC